MSGTDEIILECFEYEYNNCKYKPPKLWKHMEYWIKTVIPTVQRGSKDIEILRMAHEAYQALLNGWEIGIENTKGKKLNTNSYPDDWMGREAEIETAIQFTEQMKKGKIIPLKTGEKAIIPHFCIPKKVEPRTGRVLKWRLIRDCSHSGRGEVSINDVTPDKNVSVSMPTFMDIIRMAYMMYKWYGKGCLIGKTDEEGAFRQLPLNALQCLFCVYMFHDKKLMDMYDIWGSRSGSKHTQELGKVMCFFFMITYNGEKRMKQVNRAMQTRNIQKWIQETKEQTTSEKIAIDKPIREWGYDELNKWFQDEGMQEISWLTIIHIETGKDLLNLTAEAIDKWTWGEEFMYKIKHKHNLLHKIELLKRGAPIHPLVLIDNYVDDFFWFMTPDRELAQHITNSVGDMLQKLGIDEEISKREGPATEMEIVGLNWNTTQMTVAPTKEKKERILEALCKLHIM